ncbi:MAG: hypothetical protein FJ278_21130 [Planctomycetes bacterium]|nr:hypothetical protein [Planctomycetota bacterium]
MSGGGRAWREGPFHPRRAAGACARRRRARQPARRNLLRDWRGDSPPLPVPSHVARGLRERVHRLRAHAGRGALWRLRGADVACASPRAAPPRRRGRRAHRRRPGGPGAGQIGFHDLRRRLPRPGPSRTPSLRRSSAAADRLTQIVQAPTRRAADRSDGVNDKVNDEVNGEPFPRAGNPVGKA